jgi:hypothetical protein
MEESMSINNQAQMNKSPFQNLDAVSGLREISDKAASACNGGRGFPPPPKRSFGKKTEGCDLDEKELAAWTAGGAVAGLGGAGVGAAWGAVGGFLGSYLSQSFKNC